MVVASTRTALAAVITLLLGVVSASAQTIEQNRKMCGDDSVAPAVAIRACTTLIESGVDTGTRLAFDYMTRGNKYDDNGMPEQALRDYEQALRLAPGEAQIYRNRGVTYRGMRDYTRAADDFSQAIRLKPDYAAAYINRGAALERLGQYDQAVLDYAQAITLAPDDADGHFRLASCHLVTGRYDAAIQSYTRALALTPNDSDSYYFRGLAKLKNGDAPGGTSDLAAASRIDPDVEATFTKSGRILCGRALP